MPKTRSRNMVAHLPDWSWVKTSDVQGSVLGWFFLSTVDWVQACGFLYIHFLLVNVTFRFMGFYVYLGMERKTMHSLLPALKMRMRIRMKSPRKLPGLLIKLPLIIIRDHLLQMKKQVRKWKWNPALCLQLQALCTR